MSKVDKDHSPAIKLRYLPLGAVHAIITSCVLAINSACPSGGCCKSLLIDINGEEDVT